MRITTFNLAYAYRIVSNVVVRSMESIETSVYDIIKTGLVYGAVCVKMGVTR
jgi:hypothetical protein